MMQSGNQNRKKTKIIGYSMRIKRKEQSNKP